jgi:hypothetical protein
MLVHCSSPVSLDDRQGAAEVSSLHTPGAGMASLAPHCTRVQAVRQDVNWIHRSTLIYRCRKELRQCLDGVKVGVKFLLHFLLLFGKNYLIIY